MKWLDLVKLKTRGYLVLDNFFPEGLCEKLRNITLQFPSDSSSVKTWSNYQAINFDLKPDDWSLKEISDNFVVPKVSFLKEQYYSRAWSLRFDTVGTGVGPHTDPSHFTVNVWVTPDECVEDKDKNGLIVYRKKRPKGPWEEYSSDERGWSMGKIREYLKKSRYDIISYKFNRAIIFMGDSFHETCDVQMKPGVKNCRVSYTFLYDK